MPNVNNIYGFCGIAAQDQRNVTEEVFILDADDQVARAKPFIDMIYDLIQKRCNSIANVLESYLFCIKPLQCWPTPCICTLVWGQLQINKGNIIHVSGTLHVG